MDRILKKKKWNARRFAILFSVIAIIILIGFSYLNTTGRRKLNVERDRLSIFEVKEDVFQEYIPVNGTILPIRTIYLDASVGGIVEEKYVEDPRIGCLIWWFALMDLFTKLNKEGVTIIQVTHSEKNAEYGKRIIHLLDGRIEKWECLRMKKKVELDK